MRRPVSPSEERDAIERERKKFLAGEIARLTIEIPRAFRQAVKVRAASRNMTINEYCVGLFEADGVTVEGKDR